METQHMIKVKYWVQDYLNAVIFFVAVTTFPWFHPNDSPTITNRLATFNVTCETYDILDTAFYSLKNGTEDTDEWVTTSSAIGYAWREIRGRESHHILWREFAG
ncbi:hypothetical protein DFH06DRAFT_1136410 [Mycena polygramma]|nr:hypothetical protein DFH06DRAFT_1136410 [Mycena polygramma]